jgi:hypothetical protein
MSKGERGAVPQKVIPIEVKETFKLTNLSGIQATDIGFPTVTMDNDDLICVRAQVSGSTEQTSKRTILIVDAIGQKVLVKTNAHTDSAIINQNKKWVGLKSMFSEKSNKDSGPRTTNIRFK